MNGHHASRSDRYLALAASYIQAADMLLHAGGAERTPAPFFHLVAHGIELALKAIIARGDIDDERMIALGHDLTFCLHLAIEQGLYVEKGTSEVEAVIAALSQPHQAQGFRYPVLLSWERPTADQAIESARALIGLVRGPPDRRDLRGDAAS